MFRLRVPAGDEQPHLDGIEKKDSHLSLNVLLTGLTFKHVHT
jgi:hypothetical protein